MAARQIAILDIGSARIKLLIANQTGEGNFEYKKFSEETGLGKMLCGETNQEIITEYQNRLRKDLNNLLKNIKATATIKAIATEAVRNNADLYTVLKEFAEIIGEVEVLSPEKEANIFFSGVQLKLGDETLKNAVLVDVGGGSVQVIWREKGEVKSNSYPIGTYSLENIFDIADKPLDDEMIKKISNYVRSLLVKNIPDNIRASKVVMGSNCIEDFFVSAMKKSGGVIEDKQTHKQLELKTVCGLLSEIKGREYKSVVEYYPANPVLMAGMDKALVIINEVAKCFGCTKIVPTNESLSTAMVAFLRNENKI